MAATATAQNLRPWIWSIYNDLIWEIMSFLETNPSWAPYPQRIMGSMLSCMFSPQCKAQNSHEINWHHGRESLQRPETHFLSKMFVYSKKASSECNPWRLPQSNPTLPVFSTNQTLESSCGLATAFLMLGKVAGSGLLQFNIFFSIGTYSSQNFLPEELKETPNNITNEWLDVGLNALKVQTHVHYHFVS